MASATTTKLPIPQWRLLNILFRRGLHTADRTASRMLQYANATVADLLELDARRLVAATLDGNPIDLGLHGSKETKALIQNQEVELRATSAGLSWVSDNPANVALSAIGGNQRGRGARLRDVLAADNVDGAAVAEVVSARLARAFDANGEDLDERAVTNSRRDPESVLLKLTPSGHTVLDGS